MFDSKSRAWDKGRKDWQHRYKYVYSTGERRVWIHCASLGEFEQAKPLINPLKEEGFTVIISFFSPSGYEIVSKRSDISVVYLPMDTRNNARIFIDLLKPDIVIFIRYEFWYHYLSELNKRGIPIYSVSASFRKQQLFFQPFIGRWFRKMLFSFSRIFVIDEKSKKLLETYGIPNVVLNGDTRADRVVEVVNKGFHDDILLGICERFTTVIVAGSTWGTDKDYLKSALEEYQDILLVIAPHEITESNLDKCHELFGNSIHYSAISEYNEENTIIIDNIGMLSSLYYIADICYVGGGFGEGIHNVLEPAAHGKPVIFGPKFKKFPEAIGLLENSGAYAVADREGLKEVIEEYLTEEKKRIVMGQSAFQYVQNLSGASNRILKEVRKIKI